jgi:hypothetical protein
VHRDLSGFIICYDIYVPAPGRKQRMKLNYISPETPRL